MLVSRKYLSLIHLVARELAARVHMTKAVVKLLDLRDGNAAGPVLDEPLPESIIERPVLAAGNLSGAFNVSLCGTKGNVLHMDLSIAHSSRRACTFDPHLRSGVYSLTPDISALESGLQSLSASCERVHAA